MKPLIISVVASAVLLGQNYQAPIRAQDFQNHGFGSILNPGGVGPSPAPWPAPVNNHGTRLGATVSGRPIPAYNSGRTAPVSYFAYPLAYPVYVPMEAPAPQPQPFVNQPIPSVIINNNYMPDTAPRPIMREYSADSLPPPLGQQREARRPNPEPEDMEDAATIRPVVYLIAMKDGGVYSAVAYWLEDTTLHYITPKHDHNHASLELVDRELTDQLNKERKVPFKLSR